jgi:hypothetical protein
VATALVYLYINFANHIRLTVLVNARQSKISKHKRLIVILSWLSRKQRQLPVQLAPVETIEAVEQKVLAHLGVWIKPLT